MKSWAKPLYLSRAWRKCRDGYIAHKRYLCERCSEAAEIVHHKIYVTEKNVHDPEVTLNWDNLEALCRECHAKEHEGSPAIAQGRVFKDGRVCPHSLKLGGAQDNRA